MIKLVFVKLLDTREQANIVCDRDWIVLWNGVYWELNDQELLGKTIPWLDFLPSWRGGSGAQFGRIINLEKPVNVNSNFICRCQLKVQEETLK